MSNVATSIPADASACGERATTRIEIYAPRDGLAHGVLDGVMYLCERHADENHEVSGEVTTHRTPLGARDIPCGHGFDFVAGKAIDPPVEAPSADDWPGETPVDRAIYALTFCGALEISEIPRGRAARLLDCWAGRGEMNDAHVDAVLARFPDEVDGEPAEETTFASLKEAFRLGQVIGKSYAEKEVAETVELAASLGRRLTAAAAPHAFTVTHIAGAGIDDWLWTCTCGEQIIQLEGETVHERIIAHVRGPESDR